MFNWTKEYTDYLVTLVDAEGKKLNVTKLVDNFNSHFNLNVSYAQVKTHLQKLNKYDITNTYCHVDWPKEVNNFIVNECTNMTCTEITNTVNNEFNTNYKLETMRFHLNKLGIPYVKRKNTHRIHTQEQIDFIKEHANESYTEISKGYYESFGIKLTNGSIGYVIDRYNIERTPKRFEWKEEYEEFVKENVNLYSIAGLVTALNEKFNLSLNPLQVKWALHKLGLAKQSIRANYVGTVVSTSYYILMDVYNMLVNTVKFKHMQQSKFIREAFTEYIQDPQDIEELYNELFNNNPDHKVSGISIPIDLYNQIKDFCNTNGYSKTMFYNVAIYNYCKKFTEE